MLIVKIIIVVMLLLIVLSLGAAMFSLVGERESSCTARFLTYRIALSVATFVFIALAFYMGWIQPHGIVPPAN